MDGVEMKQSDAEETEDRFYVSRIHFPTDFGIHIKRSLTTKQYMAVAMLCDPQTGKYFNKDKRAINADSAAHPLSALVAISRRQSVHINAVIVDPTQKTIVRYEPYGARQKARNRDALFDELINEAVQNLLSIDQSFSYSCFYASAPGPQCRDPPLSGYCSAWCLAFLYGTLGADRQIIDNLRNRSDFEWIKRFSAFLYKKFTKSSTGNCLVTCRPPS